ncbi:hypothetical protein N7493_005838 [Penicillium malachiteum]|uniref:Uncharacterized protein n=1 Tax=Penicillium malachiteum TaxID=1324776 RepID=A0AAD6HLZ6_9EURO|nr:hypothetical protein N7493_005838 [Penicillium malachiteum]
MSILLEVVGGNVTITEEVMRRIIESRDDSSKIYRMLFARLGEKVLITEDLLIHASYYCGGYDTQVLCTLLEQHRPLDLQLAWEGIWKADCDNFYGASDVFLEYTDLEVTEDLLESIIEEEAQYGKPNDDLLNCLLVYAMERYIPISFHGRSMEIILEWLSLTVILRILEHNSAHPITEEMINAARKNADPYEAIWVLYSILGRN